MLKMQAFARGRNRPVLMEAVAAGGVVLSAIIAGIGVSGIVGWGSILACAGSGALLAGSLLTETAASRLPIHAEKHAARRDLFGFALAAGNLGLFALFTVWNLVAGHMGMEAINEAGVRDKRAPLESTLADARADVIAAEADLADFDQASDSQASLWADGLRGVNPNYITAGTRRLEAADAAAANRARERQPLSRALAHAKADVERAEAGLAHAPDGRPDHELWAFAIVLELLKGALVWLASSRERKGVMREIDKRPSEMTIIELREMMSHGGSLTMTATWELRRRQAPLRAPRAKLCAA